MEQIVLRFQPLILKYARKGPLQRTTYNTTKSPQQYHRRCILCRKRFTSGPEHCLRFRVSISPVPGPPDPSELSLYAQDEAFLGTHRFQSQYPPNPKASCIGPPMFGLHQKGPSFWPSLRKRRMHVETCRFMCR